MNPSIRPPLRSVTNAPAVCGPPALTGEVSWNGRTHRRVTGSGSLTIGTPPFIGMPSAPGYVPKYESKDRFSCMITITCLIVWMPRWLTGPSGLGRGSGTVAGQSGGLAWADVTIARLTTTRARPIAKGFRRAAGIHRVFVTGYVGRSRPDPTDVPGERFYDLSFMPFGSYGASGRIRAGRGSPTTDTVKAGAERATSASRYASARLFRTWWPYAPEVMNPPRRSPPQHGSSAEASASAASTSKSASVRFGPVSRSRRAASAPMKSPLSKATNLQTPDIPGVKS